MNFRGKEFKTKKDPEQFFARLEEYNERQAAEFSSGEEGTEKEVQFRISSPHLNAKRQIHMPGYPKSVPYSTVTNNLVVPFDATSWYRALCMKRNSENWKRGAVSITAMTRVTPYLLKMKWNGHPVHHHKKLGWGYIISTQDAAGHEETLDDG